MTAKRSFSKAACKRLAVELRQEIGLGPMDAFDPWLLAAEYGVQVFVLSELPVDHEVRKHFSLIRADIFSGALVPIGNGAVVVENDAHPEVRRRSTMAHELAHVVCEHRFSTSLVNERGCRSYDKDQEDEAAEVAGELLVPFDAAKVLARQQATNEEVGLRFGVSPDMARWRLDSTGARLMAQRREAAYRRASGA